MQTARIKAVLFDADGVLQRPTMRWRLAFETLLQISGEELDRVTQELCEIEASCLENENDFVSAISRKLASRGLAHRLESLMSIFNGIDMISDVVDVIAQIRRAGTPCYLATNQQSHRANHMSTQLNYHGLFDQEFYSCQMGAAKPKPEFFVHILNTLDLSADEVLLVDDREENTRSASGVGLRVITFDEREGVEVLRMRLADYKLPTDARKRTQS